MGVEEVVLNIDYNYQTTESAVSSFLNNPSHKVIIEDDYTLLSLSATISTKQEKILHYNCY